MVFAPYHALVRVILRRAFAAISAGKTDALTRQFHPEATFRFAGDHAFGGELHGRLEIGAWFARFHRLFPDHELTPLEIVVNGGPWATRVATRFRVSATLPGGVAYENEGMQLLRLRWGKIVDDRLYEDTEKLCSALRSIADAGKTEACDAIARYG